MANKDSQEELLKYVLDCILENKTPKQVYQEARNVFGYQKSFETFRKYFYKVRDYKKKRLESSDLLRILKERGHVKLIDLCFMFSCSPKKIEELISIERRKGHEVIVEDEYVFLSDGSRFVEPRTIKKPLESKEIIFAVASDLHFGSKSCQITALNEFCEDCKKEGVEFIFSPGDLLAGYKVYKGQQYELYALTAEEQEWSLVTNLPKGFTWYVIGGNHDFSFMKNGGGHNALSVVENLRNDIRYLGFTESIVPILPNVDLMMWHPRGAACYAMSYKLQKFIEQRAFQELQRIITGVKDRPTLRMILCGHYHIQLQAMFGSILGVMSGSFEGSNSLTKEKGWLPAIGGWIIKAKLKRDGSLERFRADFLSKPEIENDWKNYRHTPQNKKSLEPVFGK